MNKVLSIANLHAGTIEGKEIVRGITLEVKPGEIHAIMGPNGSGKSTLANVLMGHPGYKIIEGKIVLNGTDITNVSCDKRAALGLFLGFQYPVEVTGVNFAGFLRMAANASLKFKVPPRFRSGRESSKLQEQYISPIAFRNQLNKQAKKLAFNTDITQRSLNEGFSGGEKKKAEVLQLAFLKPKFAILDEPDSGLDVDGLKYIAKTIKSLNYPIGLLLITHYQRILHYIKPDFVHIMIDGKIIRSGKAGLAKEIENKGYGQYLSKS
jgi:Fe-S cluster assembly ATP-binding protein